MLIGRICGLFLLLFVLVAQVASPKIVVEIPTGSENQPIQAQVSVTHAPSQAVDEASFAIEGQLFGVKKVGDSPTDKGALVVSTYNFSLPGKARGLYLFPAVRVKVGEAFISSSPVSFEVQGGMSSDELQLRARVVEKGPFYPGQKVTFQYLISFRNPIQLTKETLPLLEFPGFRTVGAPKIEDMAQDSSTVQVISQKGVALEPGVFNSGVSAIEGYIYGVDSSGNKVVSQTLLQASAPSVEVTVEPFPKVGMPVSFNGAIGDFYWNVKAVGSTNVGVGEKITVQVTVSGSGDYDTLSFPDLSLQNGFKDVFRLSDLSPVGEMKDGQKRFTVNLRPIVSDVKMIPSIEFSSFDPLSKTYIVKRSDPIAITVRPGKSGNVSQPNLQGMPPPVWPIEIEGNIPLTVNDIRTKSLQDILLVYTAILLAAALAAQAMFKRFWLASQAKGEQSRDIILEAIKQKNNPDACCRLLRKALLLGLYEAGITKELASEPEELGGEGLEGEIKKLLLSIEQKRFMGLETQLEIREIINEASQLYYRMRK